MHLLRCKPKKNWAHFTRTTRARKAPCKHRTILNSCSYGRTFLFAIQPTAVKASSMRARATVRFLIPKSTICSSTSNPMDVDLLMKRSAGHRCFRRSPPRPAPRRKTAPPKAQPQIRLKKRLVPKCRSRHCWKNRAGSDDLDALLAQLIELMPTDVEVSRNLRVKRMNWTMIHAR